MIVQHPGRKQEYGRLGRGQAAAEAKKADGTSCKVLCSVLHPSNLTGRVTSNHAWTSSAKLMLLTITLKRVVIGEQEKSGGVMRE